MKNLLAGLSVLALSFIMISAVNTGDRSLTEAFVTGNTGIASVNSISFGPEGILFVGDSKNAAIYAILTDDNTEVSEATSIRETEFDTKIAAALGTGVENIRITDMAVNPVSKKVYLSVNVADGTPVILRWNGESLENISLANASYSKIELDNPVATDFKDRRGRSQRHWAISDMKYHNGQILVSGLSNKEFSSTFRSIPFPFKSSQDYASLEIWHAAHGRYETYAPIKTFDIINLEDKDYLIASYTCTPLVLFPLADLSNGKHLKGRTVAELGSGNSPLDMISFTREGKQYFAMSNSNRPVMRIKYENIANYKETMTEPVKEWAVATGVAYDNLPMVNVLQLDNLDAKNVVYLQRTSSGDLVLQSRSTRRM